MKAIERIEEIKEKYLMGPPMAQTLWNEIPILLKAFEVMREIAIEANTFLDTSSHPKGIVMARAKKEIEEQFKNLMSYPSAEKK